LSRFSYYILAFITVITITISSIFSQTLNGGKGSNAVLNSCGFDHKHYISMQDTSYQKIIQSSETRLNSYLSIPRTRSSNDVYTIPVVVHVLHLGESVGVGTNISDAQIQSAITNLNDVYRGQTSNSPVDFEIEFALAQQDPNCNAHSGINRINASAVPNYFSGGVDYYGDGGEADETVLKDLSRWPETEYFNIWIVSEIENNNGGFGIQGYANFFTGSAYEGSVMMATVFGYDPTNLQPSFNLNAPRDNSTVVHEIGHYLHLHHTFKGDGDADNNGIGDACPGDVTVGVDSDGCADTEPHKRYTSQCKSGLLNDCTGATFGDNTAKNFMSYASCQDRLTNDQKNRSRAMLATSGVSLIHSKGDESPIVSSGTLANVSCIPQSSSTATSGGYGGIMNFTIINEFSASSSYTQNDGGYVDFTTNCLKIISLEEDSTYNYELTTWYNGHDYKAYIDFNNDGDFLDPNEEVFSGANPPNLNGANGVNTSTGSGTFTIPSVDGLNVLSSTSLRLRIISELTAVSGTITGPCYNPYYAQAEDFTLIVNEKVTNNSGHTSWNGSSNSNWNDASNWSSGVPNSSTNVTISNVSNHPIVNTSGAECANLVIENGGLLTVNNSSYNLTTLGIDINSGGQLAITNGEINTDSIEHTGVLTITGGTLDINGPYHSNGNITANISGGTIEIEGNWDASSGSGFDPSGGTVVFNGTDQQTISLASGNNFYDLSINNSHAINKVSAQGSALVVSNHLNITDGIFESASDYHDVTIASGATLELTGDITVSGNWTNNGTFTPGNHTVTFDGSIIQYIAGANNSFYNLTINNSSSGINLSSGVAITGTLNLTQGQIDINSISVDFRPSSDVSNASNSSHTFDGPLVRWFNSTNPFTYPCGDGTNYRPVTLTSSNSNSNNMVASYLFANQNQSSINSSLSSIETYGWDIQRSSGTDGFSITIPFDAGYGITDFNNLTITYFDGTEWTELPSTVTGTASSGSVTTNSAVSDFSNRYFALGYKSVPKTYVPDDNFEAYLETHDASGNTVSVGDANSMGDGIANNDYVTTANISGVTSLDVASQNIYDLTGIEDFSNLKYLECYENNITQIDLSQNINLEHLHCGANQLTNLDISNNLDLNFLNCHSNQLTSLDVSQNIFLSTLIFYNITGNSGQITTIDLTNNLLLTYLRCEGHQLTNLDLSNNTLLVQLYCDQNQLTSLDLSLNTNLTHVSAAINQLNSLDLSNLSSVYHIHVPGNPFTSLDLRNGNNINAALNANNCPNLYCIDVDDPTWAKILICHVVACVILVKASGSFLSTIGRIEHGFNCRPDLVARYGS